MYHYFHPHISMRISKLILHHSTWQNFSFSTFISTLWYIIWPPGKTFPGLAQTHSPEPIKPWGLQTGPITALNNSASSNPPISCVCVALIDQWGLSLLCLRAGLTAEVPPHSARLWPQTEMNLLKHRQWERRKLWYLPSKTNNMWTQDCTQNTGDKCSYKISV